MTPTRKFVALYSSLLEVKSNRKISAAEWFEAYWSHKILHAQTIYNDIITKTLCCKIMQRDRIDNVNILRLFRVYYKYTGALPALSWQNQVSNSKAIYVCLKQISKGCLRSWGRNLYDRLHMMLISYIDRYF